jgi:hypothetical protein
MCNGRWRILAETADISLLRWRTSSHFAQHFISTPRARRADTLMALTERYFRYRLRNTVPFQAKSAAATRFLSNLCRTDCTT